MKRILLGLFAAAIIAFGAGFNTTASASTINVNPSPTDSFNVGNFFPGGGSINDDYLFTLSTNANMTDNIFTSNVSGFTLTVFDPGNSSVSFSNLLAGIQYRLNVSGTALANGVYAGTVTFTATPIPASMLMLLTAIGGLGLTFWRKRSLSA